MPFISIDDYEPVQLAPGTRARTPYGRHLMLSYLEMDAGSVVPTHSHPHEQGGMLLEGRSRADDRRRIESVPRG